MSYHKPKGPYERWFKRPMDCVLASVALVVLSPVMLGTALLVRARLGSPALFTQERPGRDERVFRLYKFRTMTDAIDADGRPLPDEERITPFGAWLRSTSLDELPELINIVKGDMAVVGPRPLLVSYLPYYTEEERHRHDVRPGLTGLAQVSGRNFLTWEEIFTRDLEYVRNCTFALDVRIAVQTVRKIFTKSEIADVQTITVDEKGRAWVVDNGVKKRLHQPLDEERGNDAT